jgi:hypothetical protein
MMIIAAYTPTVTGSQNPAVLLTAVCSSTTSQRLPLVRLKNQVNKIVVGRVVTMRSRMPGRPSGNMPW